MSAKSESATHQWLGAAITMQQHLKIQLFLVNLAKKRIRKMRDHQECIEISFMDKLQDHYKCMRLLLGFAKARASTQRVPTAVGHSYQEDSKQP